MNQSPKQPNWSEGRWREKLITQRKMIWHEDTIVKLAEWIGYEHGMTVVDTGCGLGYLGYTFWRYFGNSGIYHGIDVSEDLIRDAKEASEEWAVGGKAIFETGDACSLSLPDDYADIVMCQTLLMHLAEPEKALKEMYRVTKPGGIVVCKEPDNHSSSITRPFRSVPYPDIDVQMLFYKINLIAHEGRIKLGRGDDNIGCRVPVMMKQLGLIDVDVRINDKVAFLYPPYEEPMQQNMIARVKNKFLNDEEFRFLLEREKEEFLAGGGDAAEFEKSEKAVENIRADFKQQLEKDEYYSCGASLFYVSKGRKPER